MHKYFNGTFCPYSGLLNKFTSKYELLGTSFESKVINEVKTRMRSFQVIASSQESGSPIMKYPRADILHYSERKVIIYIKLMI